MANSFQLDPNRPFVLIRNIIAALMAMGAVFVVVSNFYQQPKAMASLVEDNARRITAQDQIIQQHTTQLAVHEEEDRSMKEDLREIKRDIKTLLKR